MKTANPPLRLTGTFRRAIRLAGLCLREARPVVQGIFLLRFLAGAFFSISVAAAEYSILLVGGAFSWIFATVAAYIYNGIQDVGEDRINGSSRPIARGELSLHQAKLAILTFGALALLGSSFVHYELTLCVVVILVMGWLYSGPPFYLKRWPAGLAGMAAVSAVITYYAGHVVSGNEETRTSLLVFAGMMALWMGLVGQTKDFSDVLGDKQVGRRSLPVVWGSGAARIAVSSIALALGLGFLFTSLFLVDGVLLPAVAVLTGAVFVSVISLSSWGRGNRNRCKRPYKAFMVTQYAANVIAIVFPASF